MLGIGLKILVLEKKIDAVNAEDAGTILEEMEVGKELDQTLVVFNILQFDLAQSLDLHLAVYSKVHLRLSKTFF